MLMFILLTYIKYDFNLGDLLAFYTMTCVCSGLHNDKISKMWPNKFEMDALKNDIKKPLLTHRGSRHSLNADGHYALFSAGFDRCC